MAAPALVPHKRPAPEEPSPAEAGKNKRPRYQLDFEDIYNYEMLEEIGEGVFGVVAKARDRRTQETVAVKWIRGFDLEDRATTLIPVVRIEAACLAACRGHPGVVQFRSVATDEEAGDLYIVMELVVGTRLSGRLTRRPFTEDETRDSMRQLLQAAEKMHAMGMIHRNMNPDNILVSPDGVLKVCGFGCATPAKCVRKLCPEKPAWTLQYCAPEQLIGFGSYGPKADVWALGCVMAELLTGEPLFTATTEDDMIEQAEEVHDEFLLGVEDAFEDMMDLSLSGREVLAGLLAFDDDDRLTAADALKHRWFTEDHVEAKKPPAAVEEEVPGLVPSFSEA